MGAGNCRDPTSKDHGDRFRLRVTVVIHDGIKATKEESDRAGKWPKKTSLEEESGEYTSASVAVLLYLVSLLFI